MTYRVTVDDKSFDVQLLSREGNKISFAVDDQTYSVVIDPVFAARSDNSSLSAGNSDSDKSVSAPMPGIIARCEVKVGQKIAPGDNLLVIEAMKMENNIVASCEATIARINCKEGEEVETGQILIEYEQ